MSKPESVRAALCEALHYGLMRAALGKSVKKHAATLRPQNEAVQYRVWVTVKKEKRNDSVVHRGPPRGP